MDHRTNASASSSSISNCYDIFLNHRGEVKKTFASHVYRRLCRQNYRVFLDQQEMQAGEELSAQIERAIATASVHIAIFTPKYAESKWCLKELVLMLNSRGTIIPVFHHVHPSDLRRARDGNGVYGEALRWFENNKRHDPDTIESWGKALDRVAEKSGFELENCNGDEGELVDRLAERVDILMKEKVGKPPLPVAEYPTGLDEKLEEFWGKVLLQQQRHSEKAMVFGIVGSWGVGKTTLAKELFNRKRSHYDHSCFLEDVRETSLISLQNKLIQDFSLDLNINSISEGIVKLSRLLSGCQALVILDDVDNDEQRHDLFSHVKNVLRSDSLILVTSRDKEALPISDIEEASIYKLKGLDRKHSQELFCLHAFHKPNPAEGFEGVVTKFLEISDGLPLSLRVLGALLYKKPLSRWEAQLRKILDSVLPDVIQKRLKNSYDGLDDQEKEVFLDIACFFIKQDRGMAIRIWEASGWEGQHSLDTLERKFLVEIDNENCIKMHDHLRDVGRYLAKEKLPSTNLRIWRPTRDLFDRVLVQPIVRGINMDQGTGGQSFPFDRLSHPSVDMSRLQLLRAEGDCLASISTLLSQSVDLLWLCWDKCPDTLLPSWIPKRNLRVLQLNGCRLKTLWQSESEAPLMLEHLEKIETEDTIEPFAEEFFYIRSLQPLQHLQHLRLQTRMELLPDCFGSLAKLNCVDLSGCFSLDMLPPCLGNLLLLKRLDLQRTRIKEISFGQGVWPNLQHLNMSFCVKLVKVEVLPTQLISLRLHDCSALEEITGLSGLEKLRLLDISGCHKIEELPGFGTLKSLVELKGLLECKRLKENERKWAQIYMNRNRELRVFLPSRIPLRSSVPLILEQTSSVQKQSQH